MTNEQTNTHTILYIQAVALAFAAQLANATRSLETPLGFLPAL